MRSGARTAFAWSSAIGLQDVDGLEVSPSLRDAARRSAAGEISISEAAGAVGEFHAGRGAASAGERAFEADVSACRIAEILAGGWRSFRFAPEELFAIHRFVFAGVFRHAGLARECAITRSEPALGGGSVVYAPPHLIAECLGYDFDMALRQQWTSLPAGAMIPHLAKFVSGIWQVHPFREGNTRTTAVFLLRLLESLGLEPASGPFAESSRYFRSALARANINTAGVPPESGFLEMFLENLVLGTGHPLRRENLSAARP